MTAESKKRDARTRKVVLVLSGLFLIAIIETILTANWMVEEVSPRVYSFVKDVPSRSAGILLGAPCYSCGRRNPVLTARIQKAAELFHSGKINTLVVSGIYSPNTFYDEVSPMAESLIEFGVPENAIIQDRKGLRTLDSILRMRDVFGFDDFIIISQRDHCERAIYLADHHNITTFGVEADNPSGQYLNEILESLIREPLARVKAAIDIATNCPAKYSFER